MSETFEIPGSWLQLTLGEVIDYGKAEKAEPSQIPADAWILELEDIEKDTSKLLQRLTFADRQSKSTKNRFSEGDVLYGKLRPYLNKVLIADQDGYCTTEILPFKPNSAVDGRFLFYWLKHPAFLNYVEAVSHGLNMPRLGTAAGKQAPLLLAPLNEQKRIADKLDRLLARVDACRERCDRIPLILKRFRQSVLAAATSGELTEDWREEQGIQIQNSWTITEIEPYLSRERPGMKTGPFGTLLKKSDYRQYGVPVIGIENISESGFRYGSRVYISHEKADELSSYDLQPGDIIISRSGTVGEVCVIPEDLGEARFSSNTMRLVLNKSLIEPVYFSFLFRGCISVLEQISELCKGSTRDFLNQKILSTLTYPIPSIKEQQEIIRRVEKLFTFADRLEARHQNARAQVDSLTPTVLDKAFRGELVPQDPNDEPASVLLEQIRSELATAKANKPERQQWGTAISTLPIAQVIMLTRKDIQPSHLSAILKTRGSLTAEDLWTASQLEIDDFYDQLKDEEEQGLLRETRGEEPNALRLLEAA